MNENVLRQLQLVELDILREIKRICEKHHLRYFLIGGTLLGAVRHKGFIPWDDDADIGMPRRDYDRFIEVCQTELDSRYFLDCYQSVELCWTPMAKVRRKNTRYREFQYSNIEEQVDGIWVDVFPLDESNGPTFLSRVKYLTVKYCRTAILCKEVKDYQMRHRFLTVFVKPIPANVFRRFQTWTATIGNRTVKSCWVNWGGRWGTREIIKKEVWEPSVQLEFEGERFMAPGNWDDFLKQIYGDYMTLPPVEERTNHGWSKPIFHETEAADGRAEDKHYHSGV